MRQVFSPKQVARALGASESSVKRWCDRGILETTKTAGGHRRVPMSSVLAFLRAENRALVNPEELGLPPSTGESTGSLEKSRHVFLDSVSRGEYATCRRLIFDLFLADRSIAFICDEVIAWSLHEMGKTWCSGELDIFQERRGCETVVRLVHEIRMALPAPQSQAPHAMGAAIEEDPFSLPTLMVELTLLGEGWHAASMGCGVPLRSLVRAVEQHRPRLFWVSVSHIEDSEKFIREFALLSDACGSQTALVVGGRSLEPEVRKQMRFSSYCDNLQHLSTFVQTMYRPERVITNGTAIEAHAADRPDLN